MDPNKTQMVNDPNRTQMVQPSNATQAWTMPTKSVEVDVLAGRECALANSPAREQFLIRMKGETGTFGAARTALNVCLVIDRSGSMEGDPLDYVKRACSYVVDMLSPDDMLSIVTFEESVDVLMTPRVVANKELIKEHIQRIVPGNTTNLYDGLSLAAQQLAQSVEGSYVTRMVVFSDGEPTAGIKDFASLVNHVGEVKSRGISCTFLGFGIEYNEELLAAMAKRAGGNYYFISRPELIPEVFRAEMDKLMTMAARNVSLHLKTSRWVALRQVYGQSVAYGASPVDLQLADVEKGTELGIAIDVEFQNHPLGVYRVATGKLSYDDSLSGKREMVNVDLVIEFTADAARCSVPQNPDVSRHVEISLASRAVEKTMMGLKAGQITSMMAIDELQKTQTLLQEDGRTDEAAQVGQAIRDLRSGNAGTVEKTLIGTVTQLDQGKKQK